MKATHMLRTLLILWFKEHLVTKGTKVLMENTSRLFPSLKILALESKFFKELKEVLVFKIRVSD